MNKGLLHRAGALLALIGLLAFVTAMPAFAAAEWPEGTAPGLTSDAAVIMDAKSGVVLYDLAMDEMRYPASITKVMTAYLGILNGNLADTVTIDEEAASYAVAGSANQRTKVGEVFTLEELLYGTMLASANDMATAIGVHIGGGSIETFAGMMNAKAAELGCTGTNFVNACGMPNDNHYTTAHDMALIFRAAIQNETFRKIINTHSYTIPPTNLTDSERSFANHDPLLTNPEYAYPGIIGGKTGNTDAAGQTLVNAVNRNGMEYIVVTMHAPSAPDAASDHIKLFDYAYANFTVQEVGLAKYRTSGGFISLPVGAKADDCTVEKTEDAGKGTVTYTYTYKGRYAGEMVMTKENEKLYLAELKAEEEKAADESRKAAGISSPDGKDGSDSKAAAESEISASSSTESNSSPEPAEKKETPLMRKILIVLGVLVAVGFGMVLVSIHLTRERRRKYKLRRKRKRGKRG